MPMTIYGDILACIKEIAGKHASAHRAHPHALDLRRLKEICLAYAARVGDNEYSREFDEVIAKYARFRE
jgi:hypothetical protein